MIISQRDARGFLPVCAHMQATYFPSSNIPSLDPLSDAVLESRLPADKGD